MERVLNWCGSNTAVAKTTRTIFQGVIGVLIAYAADIVSGCGFDALTCTIVTALVMAVLSPIQAALGTDVAAVDVSDVAAAHATDLSGEEYADED